MRKGGSVLLSNESHFDRNDYQVWDGMVHPLALCTNPPDMLGESGALPEVWQNILQTFVPKLIAPKNRMCKCQRWTDSVLIMWKVFRARLIYYIISAGVSDLITNKLSVSYTTQVIIVLSRNLWIILWMLKVVANLNVQSFLFPLV